MQRFWISSAIAAAAVFASGAALAKANLAAEPRGPVAWRCDGQACVGKPVGAGLLTECRRVVRAIGPVASYASRGQALSASEVRECNRVVRPYLTHRH